MRWRRAAAEGARSIVARRYISCMRNVFNEKIAYRAGTRTVRPQLVERLNLRVIIVALQQNVWRGEREGVVK